ncbi:unnamed protein product [Allacma fusca]|uniref:Uncharacterized protein n=1 Tax=Allacma fusca TaxID=39272 RepID=A0A8J2KPD6_9HEXA|nr:unnamed protein product [Allacma fusca]
MLLSIGSSIRLRQSYENRTTFNADETGAGIVPNKGPKRIARNGVRTVPSMTPAESGQLRMRIETEDVIKEVSEDENDDMVFRKGEDEEPLEYVPYPDSQTYLARNGAHWTNVVPYIRCFCKVYMNSKPDRYELKDCIIGRSLKLCTQFPETTSALSYVVEIGPRVFSKQI